MTTTTMAYRIRLSDTDAAGVVYFARPFEWAHALYEDFLASVDHSFAIRRILEGQGLRIPIVEAKVDHTKPLRIGDDLEIELACSRMSTTSFTLTYTMKLVSRDNHQRAASVTTTHVCIGGEGIKTPIPNVLRDALAKVQLAQGAADVATP